MRMKNAAAAYLSRRIISLSSFIIVIFLVLQAVAAFRILCLPKSLSFFSFLRISCPPALYPFLDYPMYSEPHREGDKIGQFSVVGILEDSTEIPILPEDLGLNFWLFRSVFMEALLQDKRDELRSFIKIYHARHRKQLTGLRLENRRWFISREGLREAPSQVFKSVHFDARRSVE